MFGIFRPARPGRHHRISSSLSVRVTDLLQHVAAAAATRCGPRPRRRPTGRPLLRTTRAAARLLLFCSRCKPAGWPCALLLLTRQTASWSCFPPLLALPACRLASLALRPPGRVAWPAGPHPLRVPFTVRTLAGLLASSSRPRRPTGDLELHHFRSFQGFASTSVRRPRAFLLDRPAGRRGPATHWAQSHD